jgi:2-iminobutanoate/2-iminopropanoate deaminase
MKKIILTEKAPKPIGPYSQAVQAGPFLYCSGQIALNPLTNEVVSDQVGPQAEQVMKNIKEVLQAAGFGFEHIVKTTIFLVDMKDFTTVNEIYGQFFTKEHPARSTVAVQALPKGVKVEVEVVAYRP